MFKLFHKHHDSTSQRTSERKVSKSIYHIKQSPNRQNLSPSSIISHNNLTSSYPSFHQIIQSKNSLKKKKILHKSNKIYYKNSKKIEILLFKLIIYTSNHIIEEISHNGRQVIIFYFNGNNVVFIGTGGGFFIEKQCGTLITGGITLISMGSDQLNDLINHR